MTGTIFLEAGELSVSEANGTVSVAIVRTGDLSGPATIEFGVTSDTATGGVDFVGGTGTVSMGAGQDRIVVPVQILNDGLPEPTEAFTFSIVNVDSGSTLLFPRTTRIFILDDENPVVDPPEPPLISPYDVVQQPVIAGLSLPMTFEFAPHDPSVVFIAEKGGRIRVYDLDTGAFLPDFVDLTAKVNNVSDRGLMDIALHPNFPEQPYLYAFYVVDPPETAGLAGNAGPDGGGNRFAQVVRFTADAATGYTTVVPGSEVILAGGAGQTLQDISGNGAIDSTSDFGLPESGFSSQTGQYVQDYIKVDSLSHAGGSLAFGPDGALYIATGDGTSFNAMDPRTVSVQNLDSLSGKILRVDPMTGLGLADNPFVDPGDDLAANRSKVYQSGLRNPFSIGFDQDGNLFATNTGWNSWEEIESGPPGANFGWPYYEGGDNGVLLQAPGYRDLPSAAAFYAAVASGAITITPAYRAFAHASAEPGFQVQAITGGDVAYSGSRYPIEFQNDFFFSDVVQGEVFAVDLNDRRQVRFLYQADGAPVHFSQGPDGYVYYADLINGVIGRLQINGSGLTGPGVTARVDNAYELYVNGALVLADDYFRDTESLALALQPGDQIAVHAVDTGGPAGAFFDLRLPDGSRIGSGSAWLVSRTAPGDWTSAGYDDSGWAAATTYGGVGAAPWAADSEAPFLPSDAPGQWIWSSDNQLHDEVFLRFTVPGSGVPPPPPPPQGSVTARVDNAYELYVNGALVLADDYFRDTESLALALQPGDQIAVHAVDTGGPAGAFFDLRLPDGSRIGSGSAWLVSRTAPGDWTSAGYDDSGWAAATTYGGVGAAPWAADSEAPFLPSDAPGQWIWSSDNQLHDEVFLRFTVPGSGAPPPPPPPQGSVTARVDNAYELYVNGALVLADDYFRDTESLALALQPGDQIAVHAVDTGGPAGAFFDLRLPDGSRIGSGSAWLVSRTAPGDWTSAGYDDSGWAAATTYGGVGAAPWAADSEAPFLPSDAPGQWIWSSDNQLHDEVFLRFTVPGSGVPPPPPPPQGSVTARVDNAYELYVNGALVLADDYFRDTESLALALQPGDQIAVHAVDTGGPAGAFFDLRLPDGSRIGSSSAWLVSRTAPGDWTSAGYDDSGWAAATTYGGVGAAPWAADSEAPFLPSDAPGQWIWSSDNQLHDEVFLRFTVPGDFVL